MTKVTVKLSLFFKYIFNASIPFYSLYPFSYFFKKSHRFFFLTVSVLKLLNEELHLCGLKSHTSDYRAAKDLRKSPCLFPDYLVGYITQFYFPSKCVSSLFLKVSPVRYTMVYMQGYPAGSLFYSFFFFLKLVNLNVTCCNAP